MNKGEQKRKKKRALEGCGVGPVKRQTQPRTKVVKRKKFQKSAKGERQNSGGNCHYLVPKVAIGIWSNRRESARGKAQLFKLLTLYTKGGRSTGGRRGKKIGRSFAIIQASMQRVTFHQR